MKKLVIICLLLPLGLFAQIMQVTSPLRFLALGDSYTIGQSVPVNERWPVQLKDSLMVRGVLVDTLSIIATTGWRTDHLINAITNKHLQQRNYNLVSVLIGVNNQYQGVPVSQYLTEFPQLLDSAIRYAGGDTNRVFVVSIPDYAYTPYGQQSATPFVSQEIDHYNAINKHIADSLHIRYFDITPLSRQGIAQPSLVAADGLHPSGIQYTQWVQLMLQSISVSMATSVPQKKSADGFFVFPNPTGDELIVGSSDKEKKIVKIYSNDGNLVISRLMESSSITVSLKELSSGIYTIKLVFANGKVVSKQIIKE